MTALAGLWSFGGGMDASAACSRMLDAQRIYGPERPSIWSDGRIALGRRLYKLLPEDRFDRGPVASTEGAGIVVADVRIDNRGDLADALGLDAGAASLADAALLMRALERWGEGALDRIAGDFAFAWWRDGVLLLARDPAGQRPLHYHRGDGFLAIASMPKGLHALSEIPRRPDRRAIADFLALLPETGSDSYFEGIEKVCAGEAVRLEPGALRRRLYFDPRPRDLRLKRPEDYQEALREQLDRAVAARLRGAGDRVGAHLSAGLDSPAVAATAARLLAPQGGRVTAFTAVPREGYDLTGLDFAIADEGPLAAAVAAMYPNIDHVPIRGAGVSPLAELGRNFFLFERPFLNLCNGVWTAATLDEAKSRGLKVLLTGMLGNATFSFHGLPLLHGLLRRGRLLRLAAETVRLKRRGTRLGTIAAQALGPMVPHPLWRGISRLRGTEPAFGVANLIDRERAGALGVTGRAAERKFDLDYRPKGDAVALRLGMIRRVDAGNYMKGMLGGWGVDQRDPASDRRMIEFCLSVPLDQYLADGQQRLLARRAFADRLPAQLLAEPRKGLQAPDWHEGLSAARSEIEEEAAAIAECAEAAEAIDAGGMQRLVEDWPEGRWNDRDIAGRYRLALLRGVSAGRFVRQALGANR
ncbi:MAG TPA: asparagine synthase-related protein [Allosphingosinicella sp.]|nr:asparagine synthase-related protein [Allosphingosinicella sp.]